MARFVIAVGLALAFWPACFTHAVPLRILPLGDSITHGITSRGADGGYSYRYWLWQRFVDAGIDVDFVGSLDTPYDSPLVYPSYQGQSFDPHHEGHYGWSTRMINENLPGWLTTYDADVALIHLGHNDYWREISSGNATYADTENNLVTIIESLQADNPGILVLLAQVVASNPAQPPEGPSFPAAHINTLNALIPAVASATSTPSSPVIVVDQFTGFDPLTMIYDGVHTNALGEQRTADVWWQAIQDHVFTPGDFDFDGDVDGRDFLVWQRNTSVGTLSDWQANYGLSPLVAESVAVPEPCSIVIMIFAASVSVFSLGNRSRRLC